MGPRDFLKSAEESVQGSREVDWRNAVSRAYYAAFHRCLAFARAEGIRVVGGGSEHVALVRALWEAGNAAPVRKVGKMLDDCRVRRHKADYELETEMDRPTAETVIEDVREIFATADGFEG